VIIDAWMQHRSARMLSQVEVGAAEGLTQQMLDRFEQQTFVGGKRVATALGYGRGSVWAVGMCLVVCRDRPLRDAAIAAELKTGAERPVPDFLCAGLPSRTGDLGSWLPRPGQPDGLGDEFGGAPRPLHGKLGEHGAGQLVRGLAGPLALERAYGLRELFQAEDTDRVIEQA